MMIIPTSYQLKLIAAAEFDFRFQYLLGPSSSKVPVDLTNYRSVWSITSLDGNTVYASYDNITSSPGQSGVFFGGDNADPTNGIIDLIMVSADTAALTWTDAAYWFVLIDVSGQNIPLMHGNIHVMQNLSSILPINPPTLYPYLSLYPSSELFPSG